MLSRMDVESFQDRLRMKGGKFQKAGEASIYLPLVRLKLTAESPSREMQASGVRKGLALI